MKPSRVKSAEELTQETEFARRRSMHGCEVRYMSAGRTFDVVLSVYGIEIGHRTDCLKRGKVVSVLYVLPPLARLDELLKLPVAS